ncbi:MAG TPA: wax ester/triacylglycerol synthase domain-containing protein, partial [Candidatus Udaeobacter sp.]|nr:wax ester/triacylglycerol synthase domain-containing protein [Candidatus Udaeobacter sp.]
MAGNRLSIDDVSNLALEAPDTLMHQAAVAVLDADLLLDPEGHVRIDLVRRFLESKLSGAPELRRVLRPTRQFQGRPLWVDDPGFRIENHVHAGSLPDPGGEAALLKFVEHTTAEQMDRALPLWQLWLLDGYAPGRVALVIKVHHALVDGPGMLNLVGQLFDQEPRR